MQTLTSSNTIPLKVFPLVLGEQRVQLFKFYIGNRVREGARYRNELYSLTQEFDKNNRLEAYQFGWQLASKGAVVFISVSENRYGVWVNLRSPIAIA